MIDRLMDRIEKMENPTVIGLDPTYGLMPKPLREEMLEQYGKTAKAASAVFLRFNREIIDSVCDLAPAVKLQIAMYEQYGLEGLSAYLNTIDYAKKKGMIVIGDIKRGDIASTAEAYAAHIRGVMVEDQRLDPWKEDAVTLNPYLGTDGIAPFLSACNDFDKGIFILVRTSNPSAVEIQDLVADGRPVYAHVAGLVGKWGEKAMGNRTFSKVAAVVGATFPEQGREIRRLLPRTFFLVPGYGAQGASGADIREYFDREGRGCIVNSSRGILGAYQKDKKYGEHNFADAAREAALNMKKDLGAYL
jgi:orotidine-5'-phosphate decarboxylase